MRTNHTYRIDCVPFENFHRGILFHLCDLNSSAHDIFWSNNQYLSIIALKDRTFIFFIFPSPSVHKFTLMAFYNVIRSSVLWLKKNCYANSELRTNIYNSIVFCVERVFIERVIRTHQNWVNTIKRDENE